MKSRHERDPRAPDLGLGGMLLGVLSSIVILGLVYAWAPTRTADKTPAGTTVGQGSASQAKPQQAPATSVP
jgi:hypothetical protein